METILQEDAAPPATRTSVSTVVGGAQAWITGLSLLISLLALVATTLGIATGFGQHHRTFLALRGVVVTIQGGGLYSYDSVSGAAQAVGQDIVTLLVGIPLLLLATWFAARGSIRGQMLRAGALWYFAYTYLLMAFGAAYNPLFLVYVALYSASLFALVLSLLSIDVAHLPARFSPHFARRTVAWLMMGIGALLALLWLGRIVPALLLGTPPPGLESYSTLYVQAGDLGLVVPLAILTGVLLLKRHPVGFLLSGVILIQGATLGLALLAMIITMAAAGVAIVPVEVVFFVMVAVVCIAATLHLFRRLSGRWRSGALQRNKVTSGNARPLRLHCHHFGTDSAASRDHRGSGASALKGFYTFEQSAHSPMFEEPEKTLKIVQEDVLVGANSLADAK